MAASSVMLSETFRIWKAAGLRHILVEGSDQAETGPADGPVADQTASDVSPMASSEISRENSPETFSETSFEVSLEASPENTPQVSTEVSAPTSAPVTPEVSSSVSSPTSSPTSVEVWPHPWDRFRERLARPSHSIWTYLTLGADMGGSPDPKRRGVLTQIMGELGWPKGSIAFWPLAVLEEGYLCENTALFRQGTEYAEAKYAVCFGEEAFRLLCPEQAFVPGKHDCSALPSIRSLLALPGLDALSPGEADWREALSLLQSISPA